MNTLRTFIRFALILIFLILLVVLSIFLFKLIPKGINQLATASLSLTGLEEATTTINPLVDNRIPQPVATTTGGLNGVISSPTNTGGISILENTPRTTVKRTYTAPSRTVYYPVYTKTGYKNIKVSLISTGIIDRNSGQFVSTNSFNTNDVISVRYRLENDQDTDTGFFTMRVDMPALDVNDRVMYKNLTIPGNSAYQVEARFDGIDVNSSPIVRVYTDTGNQVSETNESDNTLSVTLNNIINNNNYNYNNNNNCYWLNGYYYCNSNNNNNNCYYQNGYYNCNSNNTYQPNLTISSIEVGKMISNSFSPQTNFVYGDRIALRVRVRNNGGTFTNNWSTRTTYSDTVGTNRSTVTDNERPINPGEETLLIIQPTDVLNRGTTILNFSLDSNNNVYESNESDNNASVNVYVY